MPTARSLARSRAAAAAASLRAPRCLKTPPQQTHKPQQNSIYEKIGKGRHSVVYKGRKKKSVCYYAVKSVEKSQKARVLQEVRTMHALDHKHVLKFFAWCVLTFLLLLLFLAVVVGFFWRACARCRLHSTRSTPHLPQITKNTTNKQKPKHPLKQGTRRPTTCGSS